MIVWMLQTVPLTKFLYFFPHNHTKNHKRVNCRVVSEHILSLLQWDVVYVSHKMCLETCLGITSSLCLLAFWAASDRETLISLLAPENLCHRLWNSLNQTLETEYDGMMCCFQNHEVSFSCCEEILDSSRPADQVTVYSCLVLLFQ